MSDLVVTDLTVEYTTGGYAVRPLDGLSFTGQDGELVVLLGPSGCGKTTLLSCLAGLLTPTSGSITIDGVSVVGLKGKALTEYRRHTVGVVFQAFNLIPSLTARGNVMAPMRLAGVGRRQARAKADALLERVGLSDRAHHRPGGMSGGQQQRVAIARSLVHDPTLVVADEPTAHLDHIQVEGILRLMRELASPGRVVVIATHDDRVTNLADRVVELVPRHDSVDREPVEVKLGAGEVLFRQGEQADLIYAIESGKMEIYRELVNGGVEPLAVIVAGQYLGELGPWLNLPRSATARAQTDAVLTGYTSRRFRRQFPGLAPGSRGSPAPTADEEPVRLP